VLLPLSGGNPISGQTTLKVIRMRMQVYNEILNKILDTNVGKFGCISLVHGFMKLVHRENNPDKETLRYILHIMEPLTEHI